MVCTLLLQQRFAVELVKDCNDVLLECVLVFSRVPRTLAELLAV